MFSSHNIFSKYFIGSLSLFIISAPIFAIPNSAVARENHIQNKQLKIDNLSTTKYSNTISHHTINASNFKVLPATVQLVKQHEGFRPYAYIDTSGLPVIGYGQSRINGKAVRMGQFISRAQADAALERELYHIQRIVLNNVKVELTPYQLGALTSLVYNAGTRVIKQSTLARKLNAGDYAGAAREFVRWNKANKGGRLVVFPGLTRRRLAEQKLFLTPYPSISTNS